MDVKSFSILSTLLFFFSPISAMCESTDLEKSTIVLRNVNYAYQGEFQPLDTIDFRNFEYQFISREIRVRLKDGYYFEEVPAEYAAGGGESDELISVAYGNDNSKSSVVLLDIRNCSIGGSSTCVEIIQIMKWENSRITVSQEIFSNFSVGFNYQNSEDLLVVRSPVYAGTDSKCCPSKMDVDEFKWIGGDLTFLSHHRVANAK